MFYVNNKYVFAMRVITNHDFTKRTNKLQQQQQQQQVNLNHKCKLYEKNKKKKKKMNYIKYIGY